MGDDVIIRDAAPKDEIPVHQLLTKIFPGHPYQYANNIHYPNHCINVVAESQQKIIGFASMLIDASSEYGSEEWRKYPLYIGVVAVDEEWRGQGICTRILELLERKAQAKAPHYNRLHLHVQQDNQSATKCFEKFGFEIATEPTPDKDGKRWWLMHKEIQAR